MTAQPFSSQETRPERLPGTLSEQLRPMEIQKGVVRGIDRRTPEYQAYQILHVGFAAAPLIAGADKFFDSLVYWPDYLAHQIPRLTGINPRTFMKGVGVIEVVAGIGVAVRPKIFSYVVAGWLGGIIGNLLLTGKYRDIALRDFGLMLGALALGRLSARYDPRTGIALE